MRCRQIHTTAVRLLWPLAVLASVGVIVGSLAPAEDIPTAAPDYALHFIGYAAVTLVWLLAAVWCPGQPAKTSAHARRARAATVLAAVLAAGTILEMTQQLVGRSTELRDLLANILGAAMGWLTWSRLVRICDLTETHIGSTVHSARDLAETNPPL